MIKLVSKNSVLRFKNGRKLLFAKPGNKMLYNGGKEVVTEENLNGLTIYRRKNGTYVYPNNKLLSPIKKLNGVNNLQLKEYIPLGGVQAMRLKYLGKSNEDVTKKETPKNSEGLRNKLPKSLLKNNPPVKKVAPVDNQYLKGFENREEEIAKLGGVRAVLKMLGFTEGNGLDGKWGNNTEEAYKVYLDLRNNVSPELPTPEQLMSVIPTQLSTPVTPAVQPLTQPQRQLAGPASRSDIRYLIRDITGNNPYQYLGDLRRALRNYINGEDYDMEAIKAFGDLSRFAKYRRNNLFLKKGGLVSSNPVKRFKLQLGNKFNIAWNLAK